MPSYFIVVAAPLLFVTHFYIFVYFVAFAEYFRQDLQLIIIFYLSLYNVLEIEFRNDLHICGK